MRIFIIAGLWVSLLLTFAKAQPTVQDCLGAIPVCQNVYSQANSFIGAGNIPGEISAMLTCGQSEVNDVWYVITVQNSGNLSFTITPNNVNDDYDFSVWNLTNAPCSQIATNISLMASCNFAGGGGNGVTGANGTGCPQCSPVIPVLAGETYVINISNYMVAQSGYTLDFTASTAQIFDNIPPVIDSVYAPILCGANNMTFSFSENILCNTVSPSDFTLTGPGGPYNVTAVSSSDCIAGATYSSVYTLTINPAITTSGTFNLNLVDSVTDLCGNVANFPDSLTFVISNITTSHTLTQSSCFFYDATVNAQGGLLPYTYSWNTVPVQNTQTATNLGQGTWQCTVTDAGGCAAIETVVVTVNISTLYTSSSTPANCGQSNGSASLNVYAGASPFSYSWNPAVAGNTPTAANLAAGSYDVTITDVNGCTLVATLVVGSVGLNITVSNDTTICFGQGTTLNVVPGSGQAPYTYTWNNGLGNSPSHQVFPGTHTLYTVFVTDANNCTSATENIQVNVNSPLQVYLSGDTMLCENETTYLHATATGGDGNYLYSWNNGLGNTLTDSVFIAPTISSVYQVVLSDGCNSTPVNDQINIYVFNAPELVISANETTGCTPFTVEFSAVTDAPAGSPVIWQFGELNSAAELNPVVTFNQSGCIDVTTVVEDPVTGCQTSVTESCMINALASPVADFDYYPHELNLNTDPTAYFLDKSIDAVFWEWSISDGAVYQDQHPKHTFSDTGHYRIMLKVTSGNICQDTLSRRVYVDFDFSFYVPTAFTPNEDGRNDNFAPKLSGIDFSTFQMEIFSGNGQSIFSTSDYVNGWNGNNFPTGVYVYSMEFKDRKGSKKNFIGSITLYR